MTLLEEIQNAAVDSRGDLAMLLRKCKVLAARLGSQPLEDWVLCESNGYPDSVNVPNYRAWSLEVKGHFSGPLDRIMQNATIPLDCLPKETRKHYKHYECRESIATIETIIREGRGQTVEISTGALASILGTKIYPPYNCFHTWAEFGTHNFVELLNSVRNRILDFTLAVSKEAPSAGEIGGNTSSTVEAARMTQIFNTTVYGGAANLVGASNASTITFNVGTRDFAALARVLTEHGVLEEDIQELQAALDSDPTPTQPEKFGSGVSAWMGKMVGKAAGGGWSIGVGAAGDLLARVIASYYGL